MKGSPVRVRASALAETALQRGFCRFRELAGGIRFTLLCDAAPVRPRDAAAMHGNWDTRISRRTLLRTGGAAAVVLYGSAIPSASAGPSFTDYPFKLGVASGEPTPDGIVLWTRLAPDPLNGGGLGDAGYRVRFEVAKDPSFLNIVQRGHTRVGPDEVHTAHVEINGLKPEREYWYRFESKQYESPVGRFRTAPRYGTVPEHLKFAFVSCQ